MEREKIAGPIRLLQLSQRLRHHRDAFEGPRVRVFRGYRARLEGIGLRGFEWNRDGLLIDDLRDYVRPEFRRLYVPARSLPLLRGFYSVGVSLTGSREPQGSITCQVALPQYGFLLTSPLLPTIDEEEARSRFLGYTDSWVDPTRSGWEGYLCFNDRNPLLAELEFSFFRFNP